MDQDTSKLFYYSSHHNTIKCLNPQCMCYVLQVHKALYGNCVGKSPILY